MPMRSLRYQSAPSPGGASETPEVNAIWRWSRYKVMNRSDVDLLLVDNNQEDVDMVLHALRRGSFASNSSFVGEGAEALDFVFCRGAFAERSLRNSPKLILLDIALPDGSGLEILRNLKSDPRSRLIPIVVMISARDEQYLKDARRYGANACIRKPADAGEFGLRLKTLGHYWLKINQPPVHNPALRLVGAQ